LITRLPAFNTFAVHQKSSPRFATERKFVVISVVAAYWPK